MGTQIDVISKDQFNANVTVLAQQKGSKLASRVRRDFSGEGQNIYFDAIGSMTMVKKTSRHMVTPMTPAPFSRRRVTLDTYEGSDVVDRDDVIKAVSDPTSRITEVAGYAAGRLWDACIIAAIEGNAYAIDEARTATAVALTLSIAAGGAGFTWDKLTQIREYFRNGDVDLDNEDLTLVIRPQQETNLIKIADIRSKDYQAAIGAVVENGALKRVMGMEVVVINGLTTVGGSHCYAFARSGVGFACPENIYTDTMIDPTVSFNNRVYIETMVGAVRLEEAKVVQILCTEV